MTDKKDDYKDQLEAWEAAERERHERTKATTAIKYWKLRVRMPLGCWLWIGVALLAGYHVLRWIFR